MTPLQAFVLPQHFKLILHIDMVSSIDKSKPMHTGSTVLCNTTVESVMSRAPCGNSIVIMRSHTKFEGSTNLSFFVQGMFVAVWCRKRVIAVLGVCAHFMW